MTFFYEEQVGSGDNFFNKQVQKNYRSTILQFKKITKNVSSIKLAFLNLFLGEIIFALFFIATYSKSSVIAIALGAIVLTVFTYFVLLFYFQAKKPEQINDLKLRFIASCKQASSAPEGVAEHHLSIANALMKLSFYLHGLEYSYFTAPLKNNLVKYLVESASIYFHHEDVLKMQESCLFSAIEEHVSQIKNTPTDLEVHVSLTHAYVSLAKIYMENKTSYKGFFKKNEEYYQKKFEIASKRAIEEFNILKEFAPHDPWIHAQLAQCYHSLNLFEEEAKEYEAMLEISPSDKEVMFRMGKIYFELGRNAEGLQVYEDLKNSGYKKADELISFYSGCRFLEELDLN
jgi:tetratricopeptide (TPR) repeat protein